MKDTIRNEPIAIVGIGCRFPGGANSAEAFWNNLIQGKDAICDIPPDRWDIRKYYDADKQKKGKMYVSQAGFLEESIEVFDPHFFGISPREASGMDPQQRLLLETSYEAMENAGMDIEEVAGSNTGVFIGGFTLDNMILRLSPANEQYLDTHSAAQSTMCILSNRISHVFDLHGPSLTIDTACSSSATTTHYAVQSLRNRECDIALSGGVNIMLHPRYSVILCKGLFLSDHCRCKTFDADAQGYVRAEGAGVIVLKPLSAAIKDNDRIYSIIMETGINQDGKTPGISSPNPQAQIKLIKSVYEKAGITGTDLSYIEAHGTGTKAGDKAELFVLNEVLKETKSVKNRCIVGSVKTHIGHMEAAAGIAGIIKTALCLYHSKIPANLHFNNPNEEIPFKDICIEIPRYTSSLQNKDGNIAGINSFGYGGTNAHILMKSVEQSEQKLFSSKKNSWNIIPISAKHQSVIKKIAIQYKNFMDNNSIPAEELFYTLTQRRTHHKIRTAILYNSQQDLSDKLTKLFYEDANSTDIIHPQKQEVKELVFAFNGMGAQWAGMGIELQENNPIFAHSLHESDSIYKKLFSISIITELEKIEKTSHINLSYIAQPATFFLQAALCDMWKSLGITPTSVIGHSLGEIAAAYAAGILSKEDCLKIIYCRSKLQRRFERQGGGMMAVGISSSQSKELIEGYEDVTITADNSSSSVTLSGSQKSLDIIASVCAEKNIFHKKLPVEMAYHSAVLNPIEEELKNMLTDIKPQPSSIAYYSTVTGTKKDASELYNEYWWQNIRKRVQFKSAVTSILRERDCHFLEIGPHPVLQFMIRETASELNEQPRLYSSLRREKPQLYEILKTAGELYVAGYTIHWETLSTCQKKLLSLPSYPWQHEHCWKESAASITERRGVDDYVYYQQNMNLPEPAWQFELNDGYFPFLKDHTVNKNVVVPGAMYVDIGITLHHKLIQKKTCTLTQIGFKNMCMVPASLNVLMQVSYNYDKNQFTIHAKNRYDEQSNWMLYAEGYISSDSSENSTSKVDLQVLKDRCPKEVTADYFYNQLKMLGLEYGPSFRIIDHIWAGDDEILAHITIGNLNNCGSDYLLHPTVLDAAIHSFLADDGSVCMNRLLPVSIDTFEFFHTPVDHCWSSARITDRNNQTLTGDFIIFDDSGRICAKGTGITFRVSTEYNVNAIDRYYQWVWQDVPLPEITTETEQAVIILHNDSDFSAEIINELENRYVTVEKVLLDPRRENDLEIILEELFLTYGVFEKSLIVNISCFVEHHKEQSVSVERMTSHCMTLTNIVKAVHQNSISSAISLVSLTNSAMYESVQSLETSPLSALGHVIQNEQIQISCKTINININNKPAIEAIIDEIALETNDLEVVLQKGRRYIRTLSNCSITEKQYHVNQWDNNSSLTAGTYDDGVIDRFMFHKDSLPTLAIHEVLIHNHNCAVSQNTSITCNSSQKSDILESIQTVYAGIVTKVGEQVETLQPGDEVLVLYPQEGIKTDIVVDALYTIKKPSFISMDKAPLVSEFIKVYYALITKARIQKGSTILISNITSPSGIFSIAIAKWMSAEIIASCTTGIEQSYLSSLQIKHSFNENAVEDTKSIETLPYINFAIGSSNLIQKLSYGATFIDIGKHCSISSEQFQKRGISIIQAYYHHLLLLTNTYAKEIAEKAFEDYATVCKNIPTVRFGSNQLQQAISSAVEPESSGSVMLSFDSNNLEVVEKKRNWFIKNGAYVIIGGHTGFGLKIARWLSNKGADKVILISRRGVRDFASEIAVYSMEIAGTEVISLKTDVTESDMIFKTLQQHDLQETPIRAIFHCAMTLDDALMINMDESGYKKVMNPKVLGTWNLHNATLQLTKSQPLLVLFSSVSTILGTVGQSNYIAANAFLDHFATYRKQKNMPCTVINLGLISDTGVASENNFLLSLIEKSGVKGMKSMEILARLDKILSSNITQAGIFSIDWKTWFTNNPVSKHATWCSQFHTIWQKDDHSSDSQNSDIFAELQDLPYDVKRSKIELLLIKQFSETLHRSPDKIQVTDSIYNMGIDSLMTFEFVNLLENRSGIRLTFNELISGETIEELSEKILQKMEK